MKRTEKKILIGICGLVLIILVALGCYRFYQFRHPVILVTLKDDLTIPVGEEGYISSFISSINGTFIQDEKIDTSKIGFQQIRFQYQNDDHIKVHYSFEIEVVDLTPPLVWLASSYTVNIGSDDSFIHKIMCADDYDHNPKCEIVGEYDLNTEGTYSVVFQATDQSGNQTKHPFSLRVVKPKKGNSGTTTSTPSKTLFTDIVQNHKNESTEIGLDLSHWQGDVDFNLLKQAGVEFVFLRAGTTSGIDGEYVLDRKFEQNIKGANAVGIPVGIYFYSYANTEEKAREEARWVLDKIKDYQVDLPIAFDWENWSFYNDFHLSLLGLSNMADVFMKTVEDAGYRGILYSSKSYLEKAWREQSRPVWLAHYTSKTNYQGDYEFWQLCSDGVVSGIQGYVDINVRYRKD
ncbi:MAG: hypothetical protein HFH86_04300 [Bacilli bacterium]|nr:hypothetical protein [Bacilli bacterium]